VRIIVVAIGRRDVRVDGPNAFVVDPAGVVEPVAGVEGAIGFMRLIVLVKMRVPIQVMRGVSVGIASGIAPGEHACGQRLALGAPGFDFCFRFRFVVRRAI